jgi:hypothetical protein
VKVETGDIDTGDAVLAVASLKSGPDFTGIHTVSNISRVTVDCC